MRRLLACVAIAVAALSAEALGQVSPSPQSLALLPETAWEPAPDTVAEPERATWLPPVSSLIIPGSGQLMMGQERGAIYLVLEALFLTQAISFSTEGGRESDRFRELAFTVARAPFDPVKPDTVFEYYEKVADFAESGPFDTDPGPALVPPTDVRTFNGAQWDLAQRTFFTDPDNPPPPESPEYLRALEFYRRRAVGPNFLWTWRNAGLEQDLYRQSIRSSHDLVWPAAREPRPELRGRLHHHAAGGEQAPGGDRFGNPGSGPGPGARLAAQRPSGVLRAYQAPGKAAQSCDLAHLT
jgi:hypothetical protein